MTNEYDTIRQQMEDQGYVMTDEEYSGCLSYARRKAECSGKSEDYLPYLLPDVIREHCISKTLNSFTMGLMKLERVYKNQYQGGYESGRTATRAATTAARQ